MWQRTLGGHSRALGQMVVPRNTAPWVGVRRKEAGQYHLGWVIVAVVEVVGVGAEV